MSTGNRLDLQTLGSQPVMPKNLPDHWAAHARWDLTGAFSQGTSSMPILFLENETMLFSRRKEGRKEVSIGHTRT